MSNRKYLARACKLVIGWGWDWLVKQLRGIIMIVSIAE